MKNYRLVARHELDGAVHARLESEYEYPRAAEGEDGLMVLKNVKAWHHEAVFHIMTLEEWEQLRALMPTVKVYEYQVVEKAS